MYSYNNTIKMLKYAIYKLVEEFRSCIMCFSHSLHVTERSKLIHNKTDVRVPIRPAET